MKTISALLATCLFSALQATAEILPLRLEVPPEGEPALSEPLLFWTQSRSDPVPVDLFIVRIDLKHPELELATFIADDPDDAGPAESKLLDPLDLAGRHNALAAVNANAFGALPEDTTRGYILGMPVQIMGFAATEGVHRSGVYEHKGNDLAFWLDPEGRPHVGPTPDKAEAVKLGVNAWWGDLVAGGEILPQPGGDRHPRTAVGFDAEGRWLYLVVADGRRPGQSEGMTLHELAETMLELGTARAINLDGGGSSVMLLASGDGLEVLNRPSGGSLRPVPVMLGVRAARSDE